MAQTDPQGVPDQAEEIHLPAGLANASQPAPRERAVADVMPTPSMTGPAGDPPGTTGAVDITPTNAPLYD